ncbi:MAG: hypothetical protein LBU32_01825 [Clostridiales bacterium]|nr:hypothetical protein [Clostridiales bacterium]
MAAAFRSEERLRRLNILIALKPARNWISPQWRMLAASWVSGISFARITQMIIWNGEGQRVFLRNVVMVAYGFRRTVKALDGHLIVRYIL